MGGRFAGVCVCAGHAAAGICRWGWGWNAAEAARSEGCFVFVKGRGETVQQGGFGGAGCHPGECWPPLLMLTLNSLETREEEGKPQPRNNAHRIRA